MLMDSIAQTITQLSKPRLSFTQPSEPAKPPSAYDEKFIIAQLDLIQKSLQILHKAIQGKHKRSRKVIKSITQERRFQRL